jgi:hypothetical protein
VDEKGDCAVVAAVSAALWARTGDTPVTTEDNRPGNMIKNVENQALLAIGASAPQPKRQRWQLNKIMDDCRTE